VVARPSLIKLTPAIVQRAWVAHKLLSARFVAAELREALGVELVRRALG
jgi:hypothetical protein